VRCNKVTGLKMDSIGGEAGKAIDDYDRSLARIG
jgi:hypothetical protein